MRKTLSFAIVVLLTLTVVACGGKKGVKDAEMEAAVDERGVSTQGVDGMIGPDGRPIGEGEGVDMAGPTAADGALLDKRRVYFEYDSSNIDGEGRGIVEAHANYLVNNPTLNIIVEGHTDERGTREYNLALGERRANAVARLMQALGVTPDRIQTISYGEERPVALEHGESAW
ncbi:MAG: peptidoglycan-associated lipoprotein Pal, partial [Gammaproteobacteria bacterium]|nr:peptidoglycan-associated lipoprotein Pal [Gammaproteobacteria bacterium]